MQQVKIKSIKKLDRKIDRYDITVANNSNFFANDILIHNTSVRVANAYTKLEEKWYHKLIDKFVPIQKVFNKVYTGTRRVIIQETTGEGYYGNHEMYLEVGRKLDGLLHPGESIYGEIVGWLPTKEIFNRNESGEYKLYEDKPLFTRGGMKFLYGTKPGERDFYVYNIKWTLPDGSQIDLPWNKIKHRCMELGVKHVPEISYSSDIGPAWYFEKFYEATFVYDGNITRLENTVYNLVDGDDPIDNTHIREGIVLRVEKAKTGEVKFFKAKSRAFYELENQFKEADGVDIEEVNSIEGDVTGE